MKATIVQIGGVLLLFMALVMAEKMFPIERPRSQGPPSLNSIHELTALLAPLGYSIVGGQQSGSLSLSATISQKPMSWKESCALKCGLPVSDPQWRGVVKVRVASTLEPLPSDSETKWGKVFIVGDPVMIAQIQRAFFAAVQK